MTTHTDASQTAVLPSGASAGPRRSRFARLRRFPGGEVSPGSAVALVLLGLLGGLSPSLTGFYSLTLWGPLTLAMLSILIALVVGSRAHLPRPGMVAVIGLVLIAAWAFASTRWAESADQAVSEAGRWALYAATLAIVLHAVRAAAGARLLLASAAVGVVVVGLYVLATMLFGDGGSLFLGGRLEEPLRYSNGQAAYFLLALWPMVAIAERARPRTGPLALAAATMLGGLILLTASRAAIVALLVSAIAVLALVPGRPARAWALLIVAAGMAGAVAVSGGIVGGGSLRDAPPMRTAALSVLGAAAAAGLLWLLATILLRTRRGAGRSRALYLTGRLAPVAIVVAAIAVGLSVANDPLGALRDQTRSFTELQRPTEGSRYLSAGGNRYDYWRIAVEEFRDEPLLGVGAGNYDVRYFAERQTTESVRQPHSIELQLLAELGVPGLLALLVFVGGVGWALMRRVREGRAVPDRDQPATDGAPPAERSDLRERIPLVAGLGMFTAWLVHTSLDWLHVVPGVTLLALFGVGALAAPARPLPPAGWRRLPVVIGVVALAAVASLLVARQTAAEYHRIQSLTALERDPAAALRSARTALLYNDESVPAYYAEAAAYARFGAYQRARASLLEAARREPRDYATWALLGDLATRRGEMQAAREHYDRALRLNPREPGLRELTLPSGGGEPAGGDEPRPAR